MSVLEIKDIYYESDNTKILNGVSLKIEKGDCISIVGSSGSGKSTLLKLCADLIEISKGNLCYRGKDYTEYEPLELRRNISYCVQTPFLFADKVVENLEFPYKIRKDKFDKEKIVKLLERFGLDESILNKDINSLSGGEKQRISITRTLAYTPDILLLDEATSALDKENADKVENYIKELNERGTTIIWVTHNIDQSEGIFNKRIVMSDGKIDKVEVIK